MTIPKNVLHWSVADVAHWLEENNFQSEVQAFRDHEIDGKALTLLYKSDISELISRVGPRVKFRAKLAQLTASRNINDTGDVHNNKTVNDNKQPPNQRYNVIQVYPTAQQPTVPYVRYHPIENGIPPHTNPQYLNTNSVKQYNYQNHYLPSKSQQTPYKIQNGQRPQQLNHNQVHGLLPKNNGVEGTVRYQSYPQKIPTPQRNNLNTSVSAERTRTGNSESVPQITVIEIKKEKEDLEPDLQNGVLHTQVEYANGFNHKGEGRDNTKNDEFDNNVREELREKSTTKDDHSNENDNCRTESTERQEMNSNSENDSVNMSSDKSIDYQDSSTILTENERRQMEDKSTGSQNSLTNLLGEKEDETEESSNGYGNSSNNLTDDGQCPLENDSLRYQHSSSVLSEGGKQPDQDNPMDYQDLAHVITVSERNQMNLTPNCYRQSPSISAEDEKRYAEGKPIDYHRSSPMLSEAERSQMKNTPNNYRESSVLTEEDRRQMEEEDKMELYSNSSSTFDHSKENGMNEFYSENEHNNAMDDEMNGGSQEQLRPNLNSNSMVEVREQYDGNYYYYSGSAQPKYDPKRSIEHVTNRLAVRERSKIFRRSEKKWHVSVNETAYQMALKDPKLLQNKKELRMVAEAEVRKTYRFAKGKSRSIAIPENRIIAEERKKQKLTKDKINEMKRQLNSEGEELSRHMRQCHMSLTLANQQSDVTKNMQLREKMQQLNQQQAKLHFKMDELLSKERKLNLVKTTAHPLKLEHQTIQYNYNDPNNGPYAYIQANGVSSVPIVSPIPQLVKSPNSNPLEQQKHIHYNINEQNGGQYTYIHGNVISNMSGVCTTPQLVRSNNSSPTERKSVQYINEQNTGPYPYTPGNVVSGIPIVSSTPQLVKSNTASPTERKTIEYVNINSQNNGTYAYLPGNTVSNGSSVPSTQQLIRNNSTSPNDRKPVQYMNTPNNETFAYIPTSVPTSVPSVSSAPQLVRNNSTSPIERKHIQYINTQSNGTYAYLPANATSNASNLSPTPQIIRSNNTSPITPTNGHHVNEQHTGSYVYVPENPASNMPNISSSSQRDSSSHAIPTEQKTIHYLNEESTAAYTYAPSNTASNIPIVSSKSQIVGNNTPPPIEQNNIHYIKEQNAGSYAYMPAGILSPIPTVSKLNTDDHVRVVPINNHENMAYVNYDPNLNVA